MANKKSSGFRAFLNKLQHKASKIFNNNNKKDSSSDKTNLEIVKGSRKKKLIIRIISYSLIVAVIITLIIVNAFTPTGLIEKIQNDYAARGKGEFPVNVYAKNADDMVSNGQVALILNNTYLEIYNQNGKLINALSHGMFKPTLKVSEARFLIFDRNRYSIKVYNYSAELYERTFDKNICCADISRDGSFAVATTSDTYNNSVYVYNKKNELVYTWNSAEGYVTDVAVSNDGESVAVCLIDAKSGSYVSSVYILQFNSASPVFKTEYNTLITSLNSVNEHYFVASGPDAAAVIEWQGSQRSMEFSGVVRYYDVDFEGNSVFVCGREDNDQTNSIIIIGEDGSVIKQFDFNSSVNDVSINNEYVLILSSNVSYVYDLEGSVIAELLCDTKPNFAILTDNGEVLVLDNSQLKILSSENQQ